MSLLSYSVRILLKKTNLKLSLNYCSQVAEVKNKQNVNKVVHVAIIGAPNSGKSTLINNIVGRKICAASNKVHTTTKLARAITYEKDTQIIFLDTPGIISGKEQKKYNLPESMIKACEKSLRCANVIGVVHDISNRWLKDCLHRDVVTMLNLVESTPSFLILNKVDELKHKKQLLSIIRNLTNGYIAGNPIPQSKPSKKSNDIKKNDIRDKFEAGYSKFSDVFIVSALNGDGVNDIKTYLINNAKPANLHYSPDEFSDQTPQSLIEETVRAKFLDFLPQEIPYNLKIQLEYYEEIVEQDKILCSVNIDCPSARMVRLVGGAGGGRIEQIKSQARSDLVNLFKKMVVLDLNLKVRNKSTE